jgi:hypothetical protein
MAVPRQVRSLRLLLAAVLCTAVGVVVAPAAVASSSGPGVDAGDRRHPVAGRFDQVRPVVLVAKRITGDDLPAAVPSATSVEPRPQPSYAVSGTVLPARSAASEAASARAPPSGGRSRS